jgi:hypothetical protein
MIQPRVVFSGEDNQQSTHRGHRIVCLICFHGLEDSGGIEPVSRANQATAFARLSLEAKLLILAS